MADETKAENKESKKDAAPAPAKEEGAKGEPQRIPRAPAFSKLGFIILGAVVVLEAAAFLAFLAFGSRPKPAEAHEEQAQEEESAEGDLKSIENFAKEHLMVLSLGEMEVPILGNQPRAPRSLVTTVKVVLDVEKLAPLFGGKGGHGGGGKDNPQKTVLELNLRSLIGGMLASEGVRLLEVEPRTECQRKVKERLNNIQLDMDEDMARVLRILKGQVFQVIIDNPKPQAF